MSEEVLGFKEAGPEWLAALHEAQKDARQIERNKGIPDSRGKIKFYVAPAEDFTSESRRCLHAHGMGWFRETTTIVEVNAHTGTLKLTGRFVVYHAPSGQAKRFAADWSARSDGDALAGAHTRLTRRFVQGLLQIAVVDEGTVPEDAPRSGPNAGCGHPADSAKFFGDPQWNAQQGLWVSEVACSLCGAGTGWAPCPEPRQQAQAQAQQQAQPPATQLMFPGPPSGPRPPTMAQVDQEQAPAPQQSQPQSPQPQQPQPQPQPQSPQSQPQYATAPGYQQPVGQASPGVLPPVSTEPMVQEMQQALGATPITRQAMAQEQAQPPEGVTPAQEGSPEVVRDALVAQGLDEGEALQIAMLDDSLVVEPDFVEKIRSWAWSHFGDKSEEINKLWISFGFTPVPGIPLADRPRPTGAQAKKFLTAITYKPTTASK